MPQAPRPIPCARLGVVLGLMLAACSRTPVPPVWLDLARLVPPDATPSGTFELPGGRGGAWGVEAGGSVWLSAPILRADWRNTAGGAWRAELPVTSSGRVPGGRDAFRLEPENGAPFVYDGLMSHWLQGGETFSVGGKSLFLRLPEGEAPPEVCRLSACASTELSGTRGARVVGNRLGGAGFCVRPGRPRVLELEIPRASHLRFATVVERIVLRGPVGDPCVFRVRLDGETIFECSQGQDGPEECAVWHDVDMGRAGGRRARLEFSVEGPLALCSFLGPALRPAEIGTYGQRPWKDARPDIVVFLADTFRADNLGVYGSTRGLTPNLDRLAGEARLFETCWSTATHTLPSHASMFSGVYPHQNGLIGYFSPLPLEVETLAERLGDAGYRCGAVTDGVMVSMFHGLDQGFELFDEHLTADTLTRARAFLDADDGRPLFLFVQSYAVHSPYDPDTAARAHAGVPADRDFHELLERLTEIAWKADTPVPPGAAGIVADMRSLYEAEVGQLDGMVAELRGELERRGLWNGAYFLFTSDHGESFLEHDTVFHAGRPFEEELRVPLILRGPGLEPSVETRPVSLIDFSPTIAALAGLPAFPRWRGRSLLQPEEGRTFYAFQVRSDPGSILAVIRDGRKVMASEDAEALRTGGPFRAFDLTHDPSEHEDVATTRAWPGEMLEQQRAQLLELLQPLVTPELASPSDERRREMGALGYAGDEAR